MTERQTAIDKFLSQTDWAGAKRVTVAGDASNRRYDRLTDENGRTAILMDAPPEMGEDVKPFITIAQYLNKIGLNAPDILAQDDEQGFLILEDLGDDLYARVLTNRPELETELYEVAVDVLTHLHNAPCPNLAPYDPSIMTEMAALAYSWYLFGATGAQNETAKNAFSDEFKTILAPLSNSKQVLIQRDYHAENLLWMPERDGVKRVGLLDFQDAMLGHPAYDLVSILQDARRDVSQNVQSAMITRYVQQNGLDADAFQSAFAILGLQRNLRILGVFARLCMRDGKAHYVDLIPRVWGHIETNLRHPALAEIAPKILHDLPHPDDEILTRLKDKCATIPHL